MLLSSSDQKRCVDYLQFGCHSTAPVQSLLCPLVGDSSLICFISRNAESFENGSRYLCLFVGLVPGYDHLMESLLVVVFLCACVWPFVLNSSCGFLSTFSYCVCSVAVLVECISAMRRMIKKQFVCYVAGVCCVTVVRCDNKCMFFCSYSLPWL